MTRQMIAMDKGALDASQGGNDKPPDEGPENKE